MTDMPAPTTPIKPIVGKNVFSVLAVIAACVLAFLLILAFAVAKTGLIEIPIFSASYHGPQPVRVVTPVPMTAEAFRVLVSSRLLAMAAEGKIPPYTVTVSEGEMTGGLSTVITQALRSDQWETSGLQLAVTEQYLEFFGHFRRGVMGVDSRIRLVPVVDQGGLRFEPTDIRFGDYPVHPALARYLTGVIFSRDLGTWILTFGETTLRKITLHDGALDIVASPSP
jgi:hypothetical protein